MPTLREILENKIALEIGVGKSDQQIVRKLFSYEKALAFTTFQDVGFEILDDVSSKFSVPFRDIYIVGSTQTGYSYFKGRDFLPEESDLDLAIVNADVFKRYSEIAFKTTNGFSDLTLFRDLTAYKSYSSYIVKGYLRPDLMPTCGEKSEWFSYFEGRSQKYAKTFANVNCGIFLSQIYFESKNAPVLERFRGAVK